MSGCLYMKYLYVNVRLPNFSRGSAPDSLLFISVSVRKERDTPKKSHLKMRRSPPATPRETPRKYCIVSRETEKHTEKKKKIREDEVAKSMMDLFSAR